MSHPAVPPYPEDPTASLGANRDGHTRSFDPPPPVDPYSPPAPPPAPAYQPPPMAYPPQPPAYQPPVYQPPAYQAQPPVYQPPVYQPPLSPYQPAAGYPAQYQPMTMPVTAPTSGWSVAALVLGILGILVGWCALGIPCVLAVVFGHLGLNETKHGAKAGKGMAIAGLVLGYVCLVPTVLITIWMIGADAART